MNHALKNEWHRIRLSIIRILTSARTDGRAETWSLTGGDDQ
jgi:hypothetical protein